MVTAAEQAALEAGLALLEASERAGSAGFSLMLGQSTGERCGCAGWWATAARGSVERGAGVGLQILSSEDGQPHGAKHTITAAGALRALSALLPPIQTVGGDCCPDQKEAT